jgi:hypothetical protein
MCIFPGAERDQGLDRHAAGEINWLASEKEYTEQPAMFLPFERRQAGFCDALHCAAEHPSA